MNTIILKPKKDESLRRFHPWVFSGAIARIVLDKDYPHAQPQEGELVRVESAQGEVLGVGHYQVGSIAVRILAFGVGELPADFWQTRIAAAYRLRETLGLVRTQSVQGEGDGGQVSSIKYQVAGIKFQVASSKFQVASGADLRLETLKPETITNNTYRLIHGEGDFLPGLVVDVYADTAVIQAHSVGMHLCRYEVAETVKAVVPQVERVYYKSDDTLPFKASVEGDKTGYLVGEPTTDECWATENGLSFRIDWLRGQKTGFFIDQRENRALVERYARGKDVLNMFCYTGGFSLYALRGGARTVDSVDVSEKAVALVNANVARNFPDAANHHAYAEEAFAFLDCKCRETKAADGERPYDLIILDPPAFAKHRDAVKNALRGYQRINAKAIEQIRPGGILFTFSCSQAIDKQMFRLAVFSAAAQVGRRVRILHQLHQPQDHPINIYHPEGEYLKGLVLYVE